MAACRGHLGAGRRLGNAVRTGVRIVRADSPATFALPQPVYVPELVLRPPGKPVVHHLPGDLPVPPEVMAPRGGCDLGRQEGRGCRRDHGGNRPGGRAAGQPAAGGDGRHGDSRSAESDGESERGRTVQQSHAIQGELSAGHVFRVLNYHPSLPGHDRFAPAALAHRTAQAVGVRAASRVQGDSAVTIRNSPRTRGALYSYDARSPSVRQAELPRKSYEMNHSQTSKVLRHSWVTAALGAAKGTPPGWPPGYPRASPPPPAVHPQGPGHGRDPLPPPAYPPVLTRPRTLRTARPP